MISESASEPKLHAETQLRIPVFLAQGAADTLVLARVTEDYRARLCRAGSRVAFDLVPGVGHLSIAKDAAPAALAWIGDRFVGEMAPSNCGAR